MATQQPGSIASSSRPATPVADLPNFASTSNARQPVYRFNWDSAGPRRPGPSSVADTVDSRADFLAGNNANQLYSQRLGNFSNATVGLAPGSLPPEWSSSTYGLNAISTVLNNPYKKGDPPKAHAAVPPITPAVLPRVKRKDFEGYLSAVTPEWNRFQKNLSLEREATARSQVGLDSSRPSRPGKQVPPLESVPPVYFQIPFDLTNPAIFSAVIEQKEGETAFDPSALSHSLPLLEKMSHHADTIEQHLVGEIARRSLSFFAALSNLQDLQTESEQCLTRIASLREMLTEVDEKGAKRGLELVRLQKRLENLQSVKEGAKTVDSAHEMISVTRGLAGAGQWGDALAIIDGLQHAWEPPAEPVTLADAPPKLARGASNGSARLDTVSEEVPPDTVSVSSIPERPPIKLSTLTAFTSLPTQLQALSLQISASLTNDLVSSLQSDLHSRWNMPEGKPPMEDEDKSQSLKIRLIPLFQGLLRTKGLRNGVVALRGIALDEVVSAVQKHISNSDLDDLEADPSAAPSPTKERLIKHLRDQSQADFIRLITGVYSSLLQCLEGLQTQNSVIVEILESEATETEPIDVPALQKDLADIFSEATELANAKASKVLGVRSEEHASLSLLDFALLFNSTWNFVVSCEVLCRKMIVGLRGTMVGQAKAFLSSYHGNRLAESAKLVEDELWAAVEVSSVFQAVADMLVDGAVQDPPSLKLQLSLAAPHSPPPPETTESKASTKTLKIEDRSYHVVAATLQVMSLVVDYMRVIINLPLLTTDTMSRVIEFLKAFNSRTCQVVLGAGAMRSAGLKNITAKHLALASQSLSVMVALIPYIRETFRRHLSPKQAVILIEFDKLKRDFQEHQNEIHDKLITIMNDRLTVHCRSLAQIDWAQSPGAVKVNDYMEQLVKEAMTLSKVLSKYLPEPAVEYIMSQIFASINHRLQEEYGKIELPDDNAKDRLLVDARYLRTKISTLKGVSTAGMGMLEIVVKDKRPKSAPPPTPTSPSPSSTLPPPNQPMSPTSSTPPPTQLPEPAPIGSSPSLPSTVRKSPFAGNRRISSLLSSVTSVGKVKTSPPMQPPPPLLLEKEKMLPPPEPESLPISNSESVELADTTNGTPPPAQETSSDPSGGGDIQDQGVALVTQEPLPLTNGTQGPESPSAPDSTPPELPPKARRPSPILKSPTKTGEGNVQPPKTAPASPPPSASLDLQPVPNGNLQPEVRAGKVTDAGS